jgi:hypothetical protein
MRLQPLAARLEDSSVSIFHFAGTWLGSVSNHPSGQYIFPSIQNAGGGADTIRGGQYPFYVASSLCFLSAFLVWCLPTINQDTIEQEDIRFREYLEAHGFDTSQMGKHGKQG